MGCVIIPKIRNKQGQIVESQLFGQLLELTKSRNLTKKIFFATQSEKFLDHWGSALVFSPIGEVTLDSLIKNFNLNIPIENIENYVFKSFFPTTLEDTPENRVKLTAKISKYNSVSQYAFKYPGKIATKDGKIKMVVSDKNLDNSEAHQIIAKNILYSKIEKELQNRGFDLDAIKKYFFGFQESTLNDLELKVKRVINTIDNIQDPEKSSSLDLEDLSFLIDANKRSPVVKRFTDLIKNDIDNGVFFKYNPGIDTSKYSMIEDSSHYIISELLQKYLQGDLDYDNKYNALTSRVYNTIKSNLLDSIPINFSNIALDSHKIANESVGYLEKQSYKPIDIDEIKYSSIEAEDILQENSNSLQEKAQELVDQVSKIMEQGANIAEAKVLAAGTYTRLKSDLKIMASLGNTIDAIKGFMSSVTLELDNIKKDFEIIDDSSIQNQDKFNKLKSIRHFIRAIELSSEPLSAYVSNLPEVPIDSPLYDIYQSIHTSFGVLMMNLSKIKIGYKDRIKTIYYKYFENFIDEGALTNPFTGEQYTKEDLLFGTLTKDGNRVMLDINTFERWFDSAAQTNNTILNVIDKATRKAKYMARNKALEHKKQLQNLQQDLEKAGLRDTSWMLKKNTEGSYTGYYITPWSWTAYNQKLSSTNEQDKADIAKWKKDNTLFVFDRYSEKYVPNPKYFPHPQYQALSDTQKKFYDKIIHEKAYLELLLPKQRRNTYRAVGIRKSMYQRLLKNGMSNIHKTIIESCKDSIGFREGEELDTRAAIVDFDNKKVMELPYLYQNLNKNLIADLCDDVMGTLTAYSAMAHNVRYTNELVSALEICKDAIAENIKIVKKSDPVEAAASGTDSRLYKRLEDFMEMQVYERYLKDEGSVGVFNVAKTSNTLIRMTALNQYAMNIISSIANVTVGNIAQKIESFAKQFYNESDTIWADATYSKNILGYMDNIGKRIKRDKLSLWEEKFNILQDYEFNNQQVRNDLKTKFGQKFGSNLLYTFSTAGEHWMAHRNALALAHQEKVLLNGKKIPLWDAYEVVPIDAKDPDGAAELKLKKGVTKLDGTKFSLNDEFKFEQKSSEIARYLHGIYNNEDKSAVQKLAIGRLAMLFRRWMVPSLNRRYAKAHYNANLREWTEGYYRTTGRILLKLAKSIKEEESGIMIAWSKLSKQEKENFRRAVTEMGFFVTTLAAIGILATVLDAGDLDDDWMASMVYLQFHRLKTEIGALTPTPYILTESIRLLQSPTAAVNTLQGLVDLLQLFNMNNYEMIAGEDAILQKGRWEGYSRAEKIILQSPLFPTVKTVSKALSPEDILPFYTSSIF